MRRRAVLAFVTAIALSAASPPQAQAGTITIDFDLSNSVVSILGGIVTIPPDGNINSATARVTIQGANLGSPQAGPAALSNVSMAATVNGTIGSAVTLTGPFSGQQVGTATGSLTGGLNNLVVGTLTLNVNGLINCFGGLCGVLGTFPISAVNSLSVITGIVPLGVGGLGSIGAATLNGILSLTLSGNTAVINLVGQEVGRTFVPEPNTFGLVGLGLLGLAGVGWRRTRSRA